MPVTSKTTKITQTLAVIAQGLTQFGGFVPIKWQPVATFSLTLLQGIGALIAHYSTPHGEKI